jgi:hypothetical protein
VGPHDPDDQDADRDQQADPDAFQQIEQDHTDHGDGV